MSMAKFKLTRWSSHSQRDTWHIHSRKIAPSLHWTKEIFVSQSLCFKTQSILVAKNAALGPLVWNWFRSLPIYCSALPINLRGPLFSAINVIVCKCKTFVEYTFHFTDITTIINTEQEAKLPVTAFAAQLPEHHAIFGGSRVRFPVRD